MGLRPLLKALSAGIDFKRQNLTSTDVRFWRLKSVPASICTILMKIYVQLAILMLTSPLNVLLRKTNKKLENDYGRDLRWKG